MGTRINVLDLTIQQFESRMNEPGVSKTVQQALDFAISTIKVAIPTYHAEIELARIQGRNEVLRELIEDKELKIKTFKQQEQ
jgi:rubrerythrin